MIKIKQVESLFMATWTGKPSYAELCGVGNTLRDALNSLLEETESQDAWEMLLK